MKGIILAGGSGSRLYPITKVISKQLLPVYNKPMIYYPLSVLLLAGIKDILIITTPDSLCLFHQLLGDGSDLGIQITYTKQDYPGGLAEAFIIGADFIGNSRVALILGDNIFFGNNFSPLLTKASNSASGATLFVKQVKNPSAFGIVEFDKDFNVLSLEEKPKYPKSNYAVTGLYFYDNNVINYAKKVTPSLRGEKEITCINNMYLSENKISIEVLGRGFAWLDTGTPENLIQASEYVYSMEQNQGFQIGCIEEVAYLKSYISLSDLHKLANKYGKTNYSNYLKSIR